jgi:glutathione S-transferase
MKIPRLTLALNGKYPPQDYEDFRASSPPSDLPAENLGRMPILQENGKTVGQSGAIWRYVAKREGFFGSGSFLYFLKWRVTFFFLYFRFSF